MQHRILMASALTLAALVIAGCSGTAEEATFSGRVVDQTRVVSMPTLPVVTARIGSASPTPGGTQPKPAPITTLLGLGRVARIESVEVAVGDPVEAGDVMVWLDDEALLANVEAAEAAEQVSNAQIGLIESRLADLANSRTMIADNRAKTREMMAQLTVTHADLSAKLSEARAQLGSLKAMQSNPPQASMPTTPTVVMPPPGQLPGLIAQLEGRIAQLEDALVKLDSGLEKAERGLAKLDSASARAADVRVTLEGLRNVAIVAAEGRTVATELARVQCDLALVRAPVDGVVTSVVTSGDVLSPGAPLVTIRPTAAPSVDIYVAPGGVGTLTPGDVVEVVTDSAGDRYAARVTWIGERAVYPPSWMATSDVHMTRALPVRVTLDASTSSLAPGTPARVIVPNHR